MRCLILFITILSVCDGLATAEPSIPSSDSEITAIVVEIKGGLAGSENMYQNIAHNLIRLSENRLFSGEKLQQSLDALKQSGRFQKIHADSREDQTGLTLVFQLTPFQQIKNIRIKGSSPLFNADVLKVLTIDFGQNFSHEKLNEQPLSIPWLKCPPQQTAPMDMRLCISISLPVHIIKSNGLKFMEIILFRKCCLNCA